MLCYSPRKFKRNPGQRHLLADSPVGKTVPLPDVQFGYLVAPRVVHCLVHVVQTLP